MYQNKHFKHLSKPKDFLDNVKLKINDENETIKLIRENEETLESNVKRQKTDDGFDAFQVLESIKKNLEGDEDTKWTDFKMFLILASENKFPFENISFLLFLDVGWHFNPLGSLGDTKHIKAH